MISRFQPAANLGASVSFCSLQAVGQSARNDRQSAGSQNTAASLLSEGRATSASAASIPCADVADEIAVRLGLIEA